MFTPITPTTMAARDAAERAQAKAQAEKLAVAMRETDAEYHAWIASWDFVLPADSPLWCLMRLVHEYARTPLWGEIPRLSAPRVNRLLRSWGKQTGGKDIDIVAHYVRVLADHQISQSTNAHSYADWSTGIAKGHIYTREASLPSHLRGVRDCGSGEPGSVRRFGNRCGYGGEVVEILREASSTEKQWRKASEWKGHSWLSLYYGAQEPGVQGLAEELLPWVQYCVSRAIAVSMRGRHLSFDGLTLCAECFGHGSIVSDGNIVPCQHCHMGICGTSPFREWAILFGLEFEASARAYYDAGFTASLGHSAAVFGWTADRGVVDISVMRRHNQPQISIEIASRRPVGV